MAKQPRMAPALVQKDRDGLEILKSFSDYTPSNPAYSKALVEAKRDELDAARTEELRKEAEIAAARDRTATLEREFHALMIGVGEQAAAQYGKDSDQYQALGYKKKSEYKRPVRKPKLTV
jgi:TorA maturation chaperone TorD